MNPSLVEALLTSWSGLPPNCTLTSMLILPVPKSNVHEQPWSLSVSELGQRQPLELLRIAE